jgi:uncharacterized protein
MVMTATRPESSGAVRPTLVDGDIHTTFASSAVAKKYLSPRWHEYYDQYGKFGYQGFTYPKDTPNAARHDAFPPEGGPPGSSLPFLREQLLDEWGIDMAINNPLTHSQLNRNPGFSEALCRAINDWQLAEWTEPEPRIKASITVPAEYGEAAAREIDRLGPNSNYVQVLMSIRTVEPLGRPKYWPIYEAAERHGLPIGIHFGGHGGHAITGTGAPSYYFEYHSGMSQSFQSQVISLIYEGVFERFPNLKMVMIEGGFAWLPPLAWRLDSHWKRLRRDLPHLTRLPSEVIHDHIWLTTQPMEEPDRPEYFVELLEQGNLYDRLMFATDYPHWDFDAPSDALPKIKLPDGFEQKLFFENALGFYRLPDAYQRPVMSC